MNNYQILRTSRNNVIVNSVLMSFFGFWMCFVASLNSLMASELAGNYTYHFDWSMIEMALMNSTLSSQANIFSLYANIAILWTFLSLIVVWSLWFGKYYRLAMIASTAFGIMSIYSVIPTFFGNLYMSNFIVGGNEEYNAYKEIAFSTPYTNQIINAFYQIPTRLWPLNQVDIMKSNIDRLDIVVTFAQWFFKIAMFFGLASFVSYTLTVFLSLGSIIDPDKKPKKTKEKKPDEETETIVKTDA